ncbi:MAG TPA: TMEM175 family protein [Candidatus Eisenbacteria bacterium]|nr:TMEM175 family protein [Candidatus Eisenbacteria bacterium]
MTKGRLEAFSDGVLAIIITIMVLELKVPHGADLAALKPILPVALAYLLSFIYLGIYWNNHHHMFQAVKQVNGRILWANLHLLFWLSLIPVVTHWLGENYKAPIPVASYGVILIAAAIAYYILARALVAHHGPGSALETALGADFKGKISIVIYAVAIAASFAITWIACALYIVVAIMWLVPDPRIERTLAR